MSTALKHKHLVWDHRKTEAVKRYFGVRSKQEAIDKSISLLVEEQRLNKALKPPAGEIGAAVVTGNVLEFRRIAGNIHGLRIVAV